MSAVFLLLAAATIPLRNPFWPVGHPGEREAIADTPRIKVAVEAPSSDDDTKTSVSDEAIAEAAQAADDAQAAERRWAKARKSLKIGSVMRISGDEEARQAVTINGHVYADGDLVSSNHDGWRFTWRVQGVTENKTLRLVRIRARELDLKGE